MRMHQKINQRQIPNIMVTFPLARWHTFHAGYNFYTAFPNQGQDFVPPPEPGLSDSSNSEYSD